ncbi:hypothetical protein FQN57_002819 [Myotisia sp. PD_48]|nr:hypothetical protein FQN57_002819 [Myotisia sp. PD_48]
MRFYQAFIVLALSLVVCATPIPSSDEANAVAVPPVFCIKRSQQCENQEVSYQDE